MISFFRRIRHRLLAEGHLTKYTYYAIGEILLVVIGILIALEINNWNEERTERVLEKKILQEIRLDMGINRRDIERMVETAEERLEKVVKLSDHLIYKKPSYEQLGFDIREASSTQQYEPRTVGYESLKSSGVDIIQNDSLRNNIIRTYGLSYKRLVLEGREFEQFDNPTFDLLPYIKKHLIVDIDSTDTLKADDLEYAFENYGLRVKDYDKLLADSEFILMLQKSMYNRAWKIVVAKRLVEEIQELEELIDTELTKM